MNDGLGDIEELFDHEDELPGQGAGTCTAGSEDEADATSEEGEDTFPADTGLGWSAGSLRPSASFLVCIT
jgi:hypothetical protein